MADIKIPIKNVVVNRLSRSKYHELKSEGKLDPNQIYSITDDTLDAVNSKVTNVANPSEDADAVNLKYMSDNTVSSVALAGREYVRSEMTLPDIYDLVVDVISLMGAKVT